MKEFLKRAVFSWLVVAGIMIVLYHIVAFISWQYPVDFGGMSVDDRFWMAVLWMVVCIYGVVGMNLELEVENKK